MSMHDYEDIIEASIRTLADSQRHSLQQLRALYWNVYAFQDAYEPFWDVGSTHYRVQDLLLAAHFFYRFDLRAHPDYERYPSLFQNIHQATEICVHPEQEYHRQENPITGWYVPPYLYCEVNSQLWYRFVQLGVLTGEDALPVERQDPFTLACTVVEDALAQENYALVANWYYLFLPYPMMDWAFSEKKMEGLFSHPSLLQVKQLFAHSKACQDEFVPPDRDYHPMRNLEDLLRCLEADKPDPDHLENELKRQIQALLWWFHGKM